MNGFRSLPQEILGGVNSYKIDHSAVTVKGRCVAGSGRIA